MAAFLDGRIGFGEIPRVAAAALDTVPQRPLRTVADVMDADGEGRAAAQAHIETARPKTA